MKKEKTKVENEKTIDKENKTNKTDEVLTQEIAKKKVPKQVSQEILKKIFKNLILAIVVMIYFISCNIVYTQLEWEQMELITKSISGVFLLASIISLEFAYKRDSGTLTMTALELLVLAIHALFIDHVVTIYQFNFRNYLVISSYIFAIYYILKSTIIYTRARIKYLKSLSDISEIVKDEPVIKEAKKRNEQPIVEIEEQKNVEKEEKKEDKKQETKSVKKKTKSKKASSKNTKKENTEQEKETKKEVVIETKQENMKNNQNEDNIVKKKQHTKKKSKEKEIAKKDNEKTTEETNKEESNKEVVEEEKKQPKSRRGRKKKEEVIKND